MCFSSSLVILISYMKEVYSFHLELLIDTYYIKFMVFSLIVNSFIHLIQFFTSDLVVHMDRYRNSKMLYRNLKSPTV